MSIVLPSSTEEPRLRKLIGDAIATFGLNLSGLTVLTEAASGYYLFAPLIAGLAGAEQVYCLTKDTRYGRAADIAAATEQLASRWGVAERIQVLLDRDDPRIGQADIITNLGHVRPLDAAFLRRLKATAVLPLMWETWEFRSEDLDLGTCRSLGIPVLGTNEHHPDLRIFEYIGLLALKLLLSANIEVFGSRVVAIGSGEFGEQVGSTLRALNAKVDLIEPTLIGDQRGRTLLSQADAAVIIEHQNRSMLVGPGGYITGDGLARCNPCLLVAHICGGVDREGLEAAGLRCVPARFAAPGYMSVATDYIGPRPVINLLTAGLKVGEAMTRARHGGMHGFEAELKVLRELPLAQGFVGYHDVT